MVQFEFINEQFFATSVTPGDLDLLLADGWRHFGELFFRYNLGIYDGEIRRVFALRIDLERFLFTRSQRRLIRRNADLEFSFGKAVIEDDVQRLFDIHKERFTSGAPGSIRDFLSADPGRIPCETLSCRIIDGERLAAVSFFDVGERSVSSIYGMFDPSESKRGLGILTMLREIEYAAENGKRYYYHGYVYEGPSFYDYKKRFSALEMFDWHGNWTDFDGS